MKNLEMPRVMPGREEWCKIFVASLRFVKIAFVPRTPSGVDGGLLCSAMYQMSSEGSLRSRITHCCLRHEEKYISWHYLEHQVLGRFIKPLLKLFFLANYSLQPSLHVFGARLL